MGMLLSFFRGICLKPHANLISIIGNIQESLTIPESRGFDKYPPFLTLRRAIGRYMYHVPYPVFILGTDKRALRQKVQTQMKCGILTCCMLRLTESLGL